MSGMLLTAEQHRRIAEAYRAGGPDWTEEERAKALQLAAQHEALTRIARATLG
jgi:hypothetical protein